MLKIINQLRRPKNLEKNFNANQIEQMKGLPFGVHGTVDLDGKPFSFHDAGCFYDTFQEIIKDKIYDFNTKNPKPFIIDCGANMGLSVYFFAKQFPGARILAFEPEPEIYEVLEKNVLTHHLHNVSLYKKAVWDEKTTLQFYTDKGMGGSVVNVFKKQEPKSIETVVLADYLIEQVDFLKMDIEGAEYRVLKHCGPLLRNVQHLFVEYHSYINEQQHLDDLLKLLKENGFRYHLKQSFSRQHPFKDDLLACENMDMAINVFAYRS